MPSLPSEEGGGGLARKASHHRQQCAQTLVSLRLGGWSTPSLVERSWLGLPRHCCHCVAVDSTMWRSTNYHRGD